MAKICVAGITIDFTYIYPDFFDPLVLPYQTEKGTVDHTITVSLARSIALPSDFLLKTEYNNRKVYEQHDEIHIAAYNEEGICKQYIKHTKDYKIISITLSDSDSKEELLEMAYILTGLVFIELALLHNRFAIHASAIQMHGEGIVFSAASGTGKSTHANNWVTALGASYINGDKPLVYLENNQFMVSGSPWCGKERLHNNVTVPLKTIVFLERGNNVIQSLSTQEKLIELYKHSVNPRNPLLVDTASNLIEQLALHVPMIRYQVTPDDSSVTPLYNYLYGGSHEN